MSKHLHTWRKACIVRGIGFTPEQKAAGWPESIDIGRIARLQSPDDETNEGIIYDGLLADCKSGQLPNVKTTRIKQKPWSKTIPIRFESAYWEGVPGKKHTVHGVTDVAVDTYHVTAPALKAWLELIGESRSHHIDAWLDAVGVAVAVPAAPVTVDNIAPTAPQAPAKRNERRDLLAPLIEAAQRDVTDRFDAPAIWVKLCAMAEQKRKPLLGITTDGLQWIDANDEPRFFSLKALRGRLRTQKRAPKNSVKTPLVRVK